MNTISLSGQQGEQEDLKVQKDVHKHEKDGGARHLIGCSTRSTPNFRSTSRHPLGSPPRGISSANLGQSPSPAHSSSLASGFTKLTTKVQAGTPIEVAEVSVLEALGDAFRAALAILALNSHAIDETIRPTFRPQFDPSRCPKSGWEHSDVPKQSNTPSGKLGHILVTFWSQDPFRHPVISCNPLISLVARGGLEPPTSGL